MLVKVAALRYSRFVSNVAAVETICARHPSMKNLNFGCKIARVNTYDWSGVQVWVCVAPVA